MADLQSTIRKWSKMQITDRELVWLKLSAAKFAKQIRHFSIRKRRNRVTIYFNDGTFINKSFNYVISNY